MSTNVKNFVQCSLVTPVATNTTELVLNAPVAPYQYPDLAGGTLVIADSVARPSFYEVISYTHRIDNVLYGVVRAKEGTTARAWTGTTWVYQALTAADYIAALLLKANLNSPSLTGTPTAPTAALGTNTDQIATMAAIKQAIDNLVGSAPGTLDALNELATALGNDPNFATTMTTALAGKEPTIAPGTSSQMWLGNKTWASVLSQVQGTLLTGLGAGTNATIVNTDTLIGALAKIQNQLNNKCASNDSRLTDSREWTAATVDQATAEAGTDTTRTAWTSQRVAQAVRGNILTGLNVTVTGVVAATDTLLTAIGKLQKQINDAATALAGNVRATVLTGYLTGSNAALADTDSVLVAFGKVQGQLNGKAPLNGTGASGTWGISVSGSSASCTGNAASANTLSGMTATITELNYLSGVTSSIQTQLNGKAASSHTHSYLPLSGGSLTGPLYSAPINAVMAQNDASDSFRVINAGGTGDAGLAMMSFLCSGTYAIKMGLRADGYFGIGGWSRAAWSWYSDPSGNMVAAGNVTAYSDPRLKENFARVKNPMSILNALDGGTFTWKHGIPHIECKAGKRDYGVLADQVEAVMPEIVTQSIEVDGESYRTVAYEKLVPVLIEAVKELSRKVEDQALEIAALKEL